MSNAINISRQKKIPPHTPENAHLECAERAQTDLYTRINAQCEHFLACLQDVLPRTLQYCTSCVEAAPVKNADGCLRMLADLLLHKAPPPATAEQFRRHSLCLLTFPKFKKRFVVAHWFVSMFIQDW